MQKIGIRKLKNKNLKYLNKLKRSETILIEDIYEINSIIISPSCFDVKLIKNEKKIRLILNVDIKIIYLKKENTSLYVYKKSYINCETINIPKIIDGYYIEDSNFLNKIKKYIFVEDVSAKILDNQVLLSYFLILNIKVKPTNSIAFIINNGFGDNIFLSHKNGQNLIQQTFFQDFNLSSIKWTLQDFKIWFLAKNTNQSYIYNIDAKSNTINLIENLEDFIEINSFILKNKNELIFESKQTNKMIYKTNFRNNKVEILLNTSIYDILSKPFYDRKHKCIYFLCEKDSKNFLYKIDEQNCIEIIFNYDNIVDYYLSYYLNNIIVKIKKENKVYLFEIDLKSKFVNKINLNFSYEDILDVKYLTDFLESKYIILLCKLKKTNEYIKTLILYDLNTYEFKEIFTGEIVTFDIDYEDLSIFVVYKNGNLSIVDKLNIGNNTKNIYSENILKLPAYIKEINLKKV